jgi:peptide/nickel transport system permease protein
MLRVVASRLMMTVPLLLVVTAGTFCLGLLVPGDQARAIAGDQATPEQVEAIRRDLRLDDPAPVRYVRWLGNAATGDLGVSVTSRRPVWDEMARRWPVTAQLAFMSLAMSVAVGVPIGIAQGLRPGSKLDKTLLGAVSVGMATPGFWIATMLVFLMAVRLKVLPASGYVSFGDSPVEWFRHLIMPAATMAIIGAAIIARFLRTSLVSVMQEDYIRAAWARGLSPRAVVGRHALRNGATPVVTVVGLRVGALLSGAVVTEQIFQLPGLGVYVSRAVQAQDFNVVQSIVLAIGVIIITVNLIVDIVYHWLNPKVRPA